MLTINRRGHGFHLISRSVIRGRRGFVEHKYSVFNASGIDCGQQSHTEAGYTVPFEIA